MRLKATLSYAGTRYSGWQRQPDRATVQQAIETALARVTGTATPVVGSSRTDAGAHARGQVCHYDCDLRLTPTAWRRALNATLPSDIRTLSVIAVAPDFHARHQARRKIYRYALDPATVASPFLAPFSWHVPVALDLEAMKKAAGELVGPVDQRAFATRPATGQTLRPIEGCMVERGRLITITVIGRSFLRFAVRGIVGTLVEVGRGTRTASEFGELARTGNRAQAGKTAPAHGLYLVSVDY